MKNPPKVKIYKNQKSKYTKFNQRRKRKIRDLSSSSIHFVRERDPVGVKTNKIGTYKGGRRLKAAAPLSLTNCSDWCLSLVFVPFDSFWLPGANHKITFGDLELT